MRATAALSAALIAGFVFSPQPSAATPDDDIATVKAKVDKLYHEAEQASERYNVLVDQLDGANDQISALESDLKRQERAFEKVRKQVSAAVASQSTSSPFGTTGQLLSSGDPEQFLDGLGAMQAYNTKQSDLLLSYQRSADELRIRDEQLQAQLDSISAAKEEMADEKDQIEEKSSDAQAVLDELEAEERERILASQEPDVDAEGNTSDDSSDGPSRSGDRPDTAPQETPQDTGPASGRASAAIAFAKSQLGDAYVYGATGPDTWDCSGLTGAAWAAAGVALPRSSSAQAGAGTPVSTSSMQPGDLVFYYSPISHVGMYLGNGQLIHAPRPGKTVEIVSVNSMPITSVRRVG